MFNMETHMDYVGQYRAEMIYRVIISAFGLAGIAYGYHLQSFLQTVLVLSVGFLLAAIITMPPWPFYRRHPLKWLKAIAVPAPSSNAAGESTPSDEKSPNSPAKSAAGEEKTKKKKN